MNRVQKYLAIGVIGGAGLGLAASQFLPNGSVQHDKQCYALSISDDNIALEMTSFYTGKVAGHGVVVDESEVVRIALGMTPEERAVKLEDCRMRAVAYLQESFGG